MIYLLRIQQQFGSIIDFQYSCLVAIFMFTIGLKSNYDGNLSLPTPPKTTKVLCGSGFIPEQLADVSSKQTQDYPCKIAFGFQRCSQIFGKYQVRSRNLGLFFGWKRVKGLVRVTMRGSPNTKIKRFTNFQLIFGFESFFGVRLFVGFGPECSGDLGCTSFQAQNQKHPSPLQINQNVC